MPACLAICSIIPERRRRRLVGTAPSARNPVARVGDPRLSREDPGALQLAVLGTKPVEKSPTFTQQNRDQVDPQLVENAGGEGQPRGANAVTSTSFSPAAPSPGPIAVSTSLT